MKPAEWDNSLAWAGGDSIWIEQFSCTAMKAYSHPAMSKVTLQDVLAALADPCRMQIVSALLQAGRPLACNEVPLTVSKATVSHHFEVLRSAGLIQTSVEGTKCMTSLRMGELEAYFPGLLGLLTAAAARQAGQA